MQVKAMIKTQKQLNILKCRPVLSTLASFIGCRDQRDFYIAYALLRIIKWQNNSQKCLKLCSWYISLMARHLDQQVIVDLTDRLIHEFPNNIPFYCKKQATTYCTIGTTDQLIGMQTTKDKNVSDNTIKRQLVIDGSLLVPGNDRPRH